MSPTMPVTYSCPSCYNNGTGLSTVGNRFFFFLITDEEQKLNSKTERRYLDFTPVTVDLADPVFVTGGWTKSSGSSANKLLLLDMVDGLADAAFTLLVAGFASNVLDGFAAGLPAPCSYTHKHFNDHFHQGNHCRLPHINMFVSLNVHSSALFLVLFLSHTIVCSFSPQVKPGLSIFYRLNAPVSQVMVSRPNTEVLFI